MLYTARRGRGLRQLRGCSSPAGKAGQNPLPSLLVSSFSFRLFSSLFLSSHHLFFSFPHNGRSGLWAPCFCHSVHFQPEACPAPREFIYLHSFWKDYQQTTSTPSSRPASLILRSRVASSPCFDLFTSSHHALLDERTVLPRISGSTGVACSIVYPMKQTVLI